MKKIKGCILIFLCVVILSGMLLYFYPVKEISGYVSTADNMCFRINSDGVIEYYINYSIYHFMESGPDDCPKYRSSHAASRRLNLLEKAEINKYVRPVSYTHLGNLLWRQRFNQCRVNNGNIGSNFKIRQGIFNALSIVRYNRKRRNLRSCA